MATIHGFTSPRPAAAIFDLDRTLVPGSSLMPVARAAVRDGMVSPWSVARAAFEDARFRANGSSDGQVKRLHTRLLKLVAGRPMSELRELAWSTAPQVVATITPAMRRLFEEHRRAGDVCIVLSASPEELVGEIARLLGAEHGLGTRAEVVDGHLTGALRGQPCYGPGKLARLVEAGVDVDMARSHAYADSMSDLPLLAAVGRPVAVNPDRGLRAEAASRGWPVIEGTQRRQSGSRSAASAA